MLSFQDHVNGIHTVFFTKSIREHIYTFDAISVDVHSASHTTEALRLLRQSHVSDICRATTNSNIRQSVHFRLKSQLSGRGDPENGKRYTSNLLRASMASLTDVIFSPTFARRMARLGMAWHGMTSQEFGSGSL